MTVLETKNLKKYYGQGESLVKALDGVNLKVEQGEFVSIVGTSGSGKSTLLHMLGGLDYPTQGSVVVDGKDISGLKEDALAYSGDGRSALSFKATIWCRCSTCMRISCSPCSWTETRWISPMWIRL